MNEEINKPKQFWISEKCSHGNYFHTVDFADNGWENAIHVIELAPMLKMMEKMAEANEKLMIETYCLMTQVRYPKRLENLTKDDGSVAFAYHNARERLESYQAFKRENGLE